MRKTTWVALMLGVCGAGATASTAEAVCQLCTALIRFDPALAECFAQREPETLKSLAASGKDYIFVDLRDCGSRGSLPTGSPADGPPPVLDTRFVADAAGLRCLHDQIAAMDDAAMAPDHVFDLGKDCPAQ